MYLERKNIEMNHDDMVDLIMRQTYISKEDASIALTQANGNLVEAIISIVMQKN